MASPKTVDIEIVGAGMLGLSIAYECARRGLAVRVVDTASPRQSSSYGLLGALSPHSPDSWNSKKQFQFDSLLMAEEWWRNVERKAGSNAGYARLGRIIPIATERGLDLARRRQRAAAGNWAGQAQWKLVRSSELDPDWTPECRAGWAVLDTLSARIQPRMAVEALLAALRELDCEVLEGTAATGLAARTILATGVKGLGQLSREFGRTLGMPEKGQALLLGNVAAGRHMIFSGRLFIVPHADGTVAVGSTSEREFEDARKTDDSLDELLSEAERLLPALKDGHVVERWAHLRPRSVTRTLVLGAHPHKPATYVANGGFKTGIGMAPKVASVMATLVLDGVDDIPPEFSMARLLEAADRH